MVKTKFDREYMRKIGAKGGSKKNPNKGFGSNRALAITAGRLGGKRSKKKDQEDISTDD